MKLNVIITGTTGMVGEGVLHECLSHPDVDKILLINRRPYGISHPKVREIIHSDFLNITPIREELRGYNACFFCLGVSSVGIDKETYYRMTYTLTMHVAGILAELNPDMFFSYISGRGTDSSEQGKINWARVKGKTENDLTKLPFKKVYLFRPGILEPTKGLKNTLSLYKYMGWLIPIVRFLAPGSMTSLKDLGLAMIRASASGYDGQVVEVKDIHQLAIGI